MSPWIYLASMNRKPCVSCTQVLVAVTLLLSSCLVSACATSPAITTATPPALAKELILYDYQDDMPQSVLDAFKKEYGVSVSYPVYDSSEEAMEHIQSGETYDVVVMDSRLVPSLVQDHLLTEIDYRQVTNFKNISPNFRDLAYDPENKHCIPFNWGTTGLVVRSDLVSSPITSWNDLWDPRYAHHVAIWSTQEREVIALTLKALGFSANSTKPAELEKVREKLLELRPNVRFLEDYDVIDSSPAMSSGDIALSMGYALDALAGREKNDHITYVLPKEGALMWGDTFVIPANSSRKYTAEVFLNFVLRPDINAQIANANRYATPNEPARAFILPEILNDPVIFPPNQDIKRAELELPISAEGQKLYDDIWQQFMAAGN